MGKVANKDMMTATEWLKKEGYSTTHADVVRFGAILAKLYVQTTGEKPVRINRRGKTGKYTNRSYGYPVAYLPLFDDAFDRFIDSFSFTECPGGACSLQFVAYDTSQARNTLVDSAC